MKRKSGIFTAGSAMRCPPVVKGRKKVTRRRPGGPAMQPAGGVQRQALAGIGEQHIEATLSGALQQMRVLAGILCMQMQQVERLRDFPDDAGTTL